MTWMSKYIPSFYEIVIIYACPNISLVLATSRTPGIHYNDVIKGAIASQITSLTIVHSTVYSGADQRKHQSSASLAFVRGIHRWPAQMASNAETFSIWWRHHEKTSPLTELKPNKIYQPTSVSGDFCRQVGMNCYCERLYNALLPVT